MHGVSLECIAMLGYAILLGFIALLLEWVAGHAHRRSVAIATTGFTYNSDKDIWSCPKDQHLFPVFTDHARGVVIYRANASTCNSCPSRAACTDSPHGRQIEHSNSNDLEHGMKVFHRLVSLTLLTLSAVILVVDLVRTDGLFSKFLVTATLAFVLLILSRITTTLIAARTRF